MSKRGIVALIVIVVLLIAGGAYWYLELLPLASFVQKPEEPAAVAALPVAQPPAVATSESEPIAALKEVSEPIAAPSMEPSTEAAVEKAWIATPADTIEEPLLHPEESGVTIIDFDDLMEYLVANAPASALEPVSLPILATSAVDSPEPTRPLPPAIVAPIIEQPTPVSAVLADEKAVEVVPESNSTISVTPPKVPQLQPREEPSELRLPKIGLAVTAAFPLYTINPFNEVGYGIEGTLLLAPKKALQGTFGVTGRKTNSRWVLDATAGARVAVGANSFLSAYLGVEAGLAINLKTPLAYGFLARGTAGVVLNITENFAFTAGSGISATWFDFSQLRKPDLHFEGARVGFLFAL